MRTNASDMSESENTNTDEEHPHELLRNSLLQSHRDVENFFYGKHTLWRPQRQENLTLLDMDISTDNEEMLPAPFSQGIDEAMRRQRNVEKRGERRSYLPGGL